MKKVFWILYLLSFSSLAQLKISGVVVTSENIPIEGAAVYIDNSTYGTSSNFDGEFSLEIPQGNYILVVSHIGFEPLQYAISDDEEKKEIRFKLSPKTNLLDEVVISKISRISDEDRAYYLQQFKDAFIGNSEFSKNCKILNEEDIQFEFDSETKILEAYANEPIVFRNKALGYLVHYDLVMFQLEQTKTSYLGHSRYEELKASKRKQKRWKRKRKIAYRGSITHFLQSLKNRTLKQEGYVVDLFKRIPNPERPTEEEIKKARKIVRESYRKGGRISISSTRITKPLSRLDSARQVLSLSKKKKYVDVTTKRDVTEDEISLNLNGVFYISFPNYIKVKYTKEKEEYGYRPGDNRLDYQESYVTLLSVDITPLDNSGFPIRPLDIFSEGYWSFEKMANTLPLNYKLGD